MLWITICLFKATWFWDVTQDVYISILCGQKQILHMGTVITIRIGRDRHYDNSPIQVYRKFHLQKTENFQIKTMILFKILLKTQIVGIR